MSRVTRRSVLYSQNFLRSQRLIEQLLDRSSIQPHDLVLEIGPGTGIITEQLARRCGQILGIEKDPKLAKLLRHRFADASNVTIREADFLELPLPRGVYKVFASIPFNITAQILAKLTDSARSPEDAYLIVQREAAAKFRGEPRESLASVLMKPWFEPTIVHRFEQTDFAPVPRIDVVMLRLRKRGPPLVQNRDAQLFRDFVAYAFTAWQPTLLRTLEGILGRGRARQVAREIAIDRDVTPSTLPFDKWLNLFAVFRAVGSPIARQQIVGSQRRLTLQQQGLQKIHRTRAVGTARAGRRTRSSRPIDRCRPPPALSPILGREDRRRPPQRP